MSPSLFAQAARDIADVARQTNELLSDLGDTGRGDGLAAVSAAFATFADRIDQLAEEEVAVSW